MTGVTVVDHPLVARHLSVLRDRATPSSDFRRRLSDISMLLLYEALRDLRVREDAIETPLETTGGMRLADEIVVIAILRAGLGHDRRRAAADPRGARRPPRPLPRRGVAAAGRLLRVDPAPRGGRRGRRRRPDARDRRLRGERARAASSATCRGRLRFVCLVAAPEGLAAMRAAHPEVPIFCAAVDRELDGRGYIRPGLGDAGDRIFGTD